MRQWIFIKKEFKKAFQLFLLLSNYDHDLSMFQLARMYEKGIGIKKDIILSRKWRERRNSYEIFSLIILFIFI